MVTSSCIYFWFEIHILTVRDVVCHAESCGVVVNAEADWMHEHVVIPVQSKTYSSCPLTVDLTLAHITSSVL
jgi:hypothetical protein